jgi:hypothetical protein
MAQMGVVKINVSVSVCFSGRIKNGRCRYVWSGSSRGSPMTRFGGETMGGLVAGRGHGGYIQG